MCRELLACGMSPDSALDVYRAGTLALSIRSIGTAAKYTVKDDSRGTPRLALYGGAPGVATASPIRNSMPETAQPASGADGGVP